MPLQAQVFTEIGRFGEAGTINGQFNNPRALSISKDKTVYVADTGNHRVQLFDLYGQFKKSIGGFGFSDDQFDAPYDIWVNSLINIFVADYNNQRLQRYDRNMNFLNSMSSNEGAASEFQFTEVASCAVSSQNDLFVLDHDEFKIIKFRRDGTAERAFGGFSSDEFEFISPEQIDMWGSDKLIVSDSGARAIFIFDLFGNLISKVTHPYFKQPQGICVDQQKNIYVADPDAQKVFIIHSSLKQISEIKPKQVFTAPQDIAITIIKENHVLFVIDGNQVIIGKINSTEAGK